jgi:SAM-dependent methyltransferase
MPEPHERIIPLYQEHAADWDALRGTDFREREWIDRFLGHVPAGGRVLDLGCGGGRPIAAYMIERGYRVTGLDSSAPLIALCRSRFPNEEWLVGDMRALDLDRHFDGIIAWHSFFHLPFDDQRAMFPRFAAHARAGDPLTFTAGPAHGEALGEWQGEPLYHASLAPDEYQALLEASGYELLSADAADPIASRILLARLT